jgi:hypothetical protein
MRILETVLRIVLLEKLLPIKGILSTRPANKLPISYILHSQSITMAWNCRWKAMLLDSRWVAATVLLHLTSAISSRPSALKISNFLLFEAEILGGFLGGQFVYDFFYFCLAIVNQEVVTSFLNCYSFLDT